MNGADRLLETLEASGVEVCFANPGTSELHLVNAIGNSDRMRAILCLFEGVVSGAADGYARMSDKPALTLLHLGSGFANSMANQHNAKRAHVPLVNVIGEHATHHLQYDAPLTSDISALASTCSGWLRTSASPEDLSAQGAAAVQAAMTGSGQIATLIAPADHAWGPASCSAPPLPAPSRKTAPGQLIQKAAALLKNGKPTALMLGGWALREVSLESAGRIAKACGARLLCGVFPVRLQRGVGRVPVEKLPYFAEHAFEFLQPFEQMILVGESAPVAFFAYPGKPSWLVPDHCEVLTLCEVDTDPARTLEALAATLDASEPAAVVPAAAAPPKEPSGLLTPLALAQSLAILMPENAIISDESVTCGLVVFPVTANAKRHDWLTLTGGAIGQGLPLAFGASVACPNRKVIALQADGSAMYTLQALWSMAREKTDVTVVILNNRSYAILNIEIARVGAAQPSPKALSMFDLSQPELDWVSLARGMGVPAGRADSAGEFHELLQTALASPGPFLIDALVQQSMPG